MLKWLDQHWKLAAVFVAVLVLLAAIFGYEAYEATKPQFTFVPVSLNEETQELTGDFMVTLGWQHRTEKQVELFFGAPYQEEHKLYYVGDRVYSERITFPVDEEITVRITVWEEGEEAEFLFLGDQFSLLPVDRHSCSIIMPEYSNGVLNLNNSFGFGAKGTDGAGRRVDEPEFRFYHNDTLVQTLDGVEQNNGKFYEYGTDGSEYVQIPCDPGDTVHIAFFCKDGYGIGYEFELISYQITEEGAEEHAFENGVPLLTWEK